MSTKPNGAVCFCGRPAGHTGRHIGHSPAAKAGKPTKAEPGQKLRAIVAGEISRHHTNIARLKQVLRSAQDELLATESRLGPLVALAEAYDLPALPAPEKPAKTVAPPLDTKPAIAPSAPHPPKTVAPQPTSRADALNRVAAAIPSRAPAVVQADSDGAIEADFEMVQAWATPRSLVFREWDDLPRVNAKREALSFPPFKRKLPGRPVGART